MSKIFFTVISSERPMIIIDDRGQSNSVGRAEINRLASGTLNPNGYVSSPTGLRIFYKSSYDITNNGSWTNYVGGTNSVEPDSESTLNCFGKEISLGTKIYQRLGKPVHLVKSGYGGTALYQNGSQDWDPDSSGELFDISCNAYFNPAVTAFNAAYPNKPKRAVMLWHQGENDALNGTYTAGYSANFTSFVTAWRASNSLLANAPLFITLLNFNQSANEKTINEVFITYANANANVYVVNANVDPTAYLATLSVQPNAGKCIDVDLTYARKVDLPALIKSTYPPTASDDNHSSEEFQLRVGEEIFNKLVLIGYL